MKTFEVLIEKLENNTLALERLENRYNDKLTSQSYLIFRTEHQRQTELKWIVKVQKRVLRMRYTLLENIKSEVVKEMNTVSNFQRELNLKQHNPGKEKSLLDNLFENFAETQRVEIDMKDPFRIEPLAKKMKQLKTKMNTIITD